jgi:hypothetical protein
MLFGSQMEKYLCRVELQKRSLKLQINSGSQADEKLNIRF